MDFNLPPEMEHNIVYYGELFPILKRIMQLIMDVSDNSATHINRVLDVIGDVIDDTEYKRLRDMRFLFSLLSDIGYGPFDKLAQHYADWCEEYDKLNKGDKNES
jgi:hypothetical protein